MGSTGMAVASGGSGQFAFQRIIRLLLILLVTFSSPSTAQNVGRQVVPFLDSTFVGFGRADRNTTFEADIVPNFVVRQTFVDTITDEHQQPDSEWRFAWSVSGVPMVKIRMFINETSSPVRTPSYMPKVTGQLFLFHLHPRRVHLWSVMGTVGHHSNGQAGCLFETSFRDENDECTPPVEGVSAATRINKENGSFSTNYLQLGGRYRWIRLESRAAAAAVRESDMDVTVGLDLEVNPESFGIDPDLRSIYGGTRITASFAAAKRRVGFCERLEGKGSFKFIHDHPSTVPAVAQTYEGTCLFRETGWGLFGRYYQGQDYYNLGFLDDVKRFQFGVTYSQEGFLRFSAS